MAYGKVVAGGFLVIVDSNIQNEIGKGKFDRNQGYSYEARV